MAEAVSMVTIDTARRTMIARLESLLRAGPREATFGSFTTAYTNVTHIVAHIEANARFMQQDQSVDQIIRFLRSEKFCTKAVHWLGYVQPTSSTEEWMLAEWRTFLQEGASSGPYGKDEEERLTRTFAELLGEAAESVAMFLQRLGVAHETGGHDAAFFSLASMVGDRATRAKLQLAWVATKNARNEALLTALDHLVDWRFRRANYDGFRTPLDRSLSSATVSSKTISNFLVAYLENAAALAGSLSECIQSAVGKPIGWAVDFPRFLTAAGMPRPALVLPLESCIDLVSSVAHRAFGLTLMSARATNRRTPEMEIAVYREGTQVGIVLLYASDTAGGDVALPVPRVRHRRLSATLPVGYVLCRTIDDRQHVGFDTARVLFHEFGHALIHILARDQSPGVSGLNYLPVERLELLSTWFEYWVYHPAFDRAVTRSEGMLEALSHARTTKTFEFMKSNLSRAVCAIVDFQVHSEPGISARTVVHRLRERHPEIGEVIEAELLADFSHPFLRAHPGCSFVYLFASSYAAEKFLTLPDLSIDELTPEACGLQFAVSGTGTCPVLDPTAPSTFFGRMTPALNGH